MLGDLLVDADMGLAHTGTNTARGASIPVDLDPSGRNAIHQPEGGAIGADILAEGPRAEDVDDHKPAHSKRQQGAAKPGQIAPEVVGHKRSPPARVVGEPQRGKRAAVEDGAQGGPYKHVEHGDRGDQEKDA